MFYDTGIAVEIPAGYVGLVFQRSSVLRKPGYALQCGGVIDATYRGSISCFQCRLMAVAVPYKVGDRIGQIVFVPIPDVELVESDELSETERGAGGYGSTGK